MKLVTYEKPEISEIPVYNLKSMILLFVADYEPDDSKTNDAGEKSAKQYIECMFAAYDENDNIHLFAQLYTYGPNEADYVAVMKKSHFYDGSLNSSQLITTINFFTGRISPERTDFISYPTEDGKYKFYAFKYAYTDDNKIKFEQPVVYIIDNKIELGLEIVHDIIGSDTLLSDGIIEANLWMYDETNENYNAYKNLYKHESVEYYTIKDISKTTKHRKHNYTGAVAMEIVTKSGDDSDGSIYTVIIPYIRTKALRRKDLTMDMGLMEKVYEGAYVIGLYGASPMNPDDSDIYRIIGYSNSLNRYIVLDFTRELHNKFCNEINNIE